ncbi:MAG: IS1096 element passenger TnpR family protein [Ferruginibacter sp.]
MAVLKFRIYWEEDESIYRDVAIKHTQTFEELHQTILKSYEFDNKHKATFFRSNDNWLRGREISLEKYEDRTYKVDPLVMSEVLIASEVKDPNQKFVYLYDFNKLWTFMVELINVDKEENKKLTYPACVRTEGIAPSQYGTKGLVDSRLAEVEEKYDLNPTSILDGFSEEDEDGNATSSEEEHGEEEAGQEDF